MEASGSGAPGAPVGAEVSGVSVDAATPAPQGPSRKETYDRLLGEHGPLRPGFDVRQAARTHASIASLLSGFAFAAVVLLASASDNFPRQCQPLTCGALAERASLAFLVAVLCLVLAAFAFAAISGEEVMARRCHKAMGFAAGGFVGGIATVFWGLAALAGTFLSRAAVTIAVAAFLIMTALGILFVGFTALDAKAAFDPEDPGSDRRTLKAGDHRIYLPATAVLAVGVTVRIVLGSQIKAAWFFHASLWLIIVLGTLGIVGSLLASVQDPDTAWRDRAAAAWLAIIACALSCLVIMVPPL